MCWKIINAMTTGFANSLSRQDKEHFNEK